MDKQSGAVHVIKRFLQAIIMQRALVVKERVNGNQQIKHLQLAFFVYQLSGRS